MKIARDKQLHFYAGFVIGGVGLLFLDPLWAGMLVVAVAVGKEVWDMMGHGTPEAPDSLFTVAGGLAGMLLVAVLRAIR